MLHSVLPSPFIFEEFIRILIHSIACKDQIAPVLAAEIQTKYLLTMSKLVFLLPHVLVSCSLPPQKRPPHCNTTSSSRHDSLSYFSCSHSNARLIETALDSGEDALPSKKSISLVVKIMEDNHNMEGSFIRVAASVSTKSTDGAESSTGSDLLGTEAPAASTEQAHYSSGSGAAGNEKAMVKAPNSDQPVSF